MTRPTQTVKLSNCEVDIVTYLSWGEKEDLQAVLLKGASLQGVTGEAKVDFDSSVLSEAKLKLLEVAVKEIREYIPSGDKKVEFTREWMRDLSVEDGDTLYEAVDALSKKKS